MSHLREHPFATTGYTDQGPLAQGGFSIVHLVKDETLGRLIAMKVLREGMRGRNAALDRFVREAQITAQLDHPCIPAVHELGAYWFTMKRVEGWTFREFVKNNSASPSMFSAMLGNAVEVIQKICDTLAFAHDRGIIHCDLKPDNVMIGRFGQVYVMDWGIARQIGEVDDEGAGTPGWMPPEQARAQPCDARSDVYGVGGLLYHALCGGRPHEGVDARARMESAREGTVRPPQEVVPGRRLPPELVRIAMKAMDPDPAQRQQSMLDFQNELKAAQRNGWWFETRSVPRGFRLIREGQIGDCAYLLVRGKCDILWDGVVVGTLNPGEVVGEAALLAHSTRTATVVATVDSVVRVITRDSLEEELSHSEWMGSLVRSLGRRFHNVVAGNRE